MHILCVEKPAPDDYLLCIACRCRVPYRIWMYHIHSELHARLRPGFCQREADRQKIMHSEDESEICYEEKEPVEELLQKRSWAVVHH